MPRRKRKERARTRRRRLEREIEKIVQRLGTGGLDKLRPLICLAPGEQCPVCAESGEQALAVEGDKLTEWVRAIEDELRRQGQRTDMENMTDEELADHFQRVLEISSHMDPLF